MRNETCHLLVHGSTPLKKSKEKLGTNKILIKSMWLYINWSYKKRLKNTIPFSHLRWSLSIKYRISWVLLAGLYQIAFKGYIFTFLAYPKATHISSFTWKWCSASGMRRNVCPGTAPALACMTRGLRHSLQRHALTLPLPAHWHCDRQSPGIAGPQWWVMLSFQASDSLTKTHLTIWPKGISIPTPIVCGDPPNCWHHRLLSACRLNSPVVQGVSKGLGWFSKRG